MTRLLAFSLTALMLAAAGCNKESTELPVDGRDFDGVGYSTTAVYSGRVIDGYLREARVWLDVDGNGQYTPGPLTLTLDSGINIVLEEGEPTAMSGAGGQFRLDISGLARDAGEAPDLDPRSFALFALALPGRTLEETASGDRPVERAFLLSAPPGVRNVTPLTTLARHLGLMGVALGDDSTRELAALLGSINLYGDYVVAGDHRAHAYARAFARYLAGQFPDSANAVLAAGDGTETVLGASEIFLLGASLVRGAPDILRAVDEAAPSGRYDNVDVAEVVLPGVAPDLTNPVLLRRQRVSAVPDSGDLPTGSSHLAISAELVFDYQADGRLISITADGCMMPSMIEMVRLANADGRMAATGTQWRPTLSLAPASRTFFDQKGADERLAFDWSARRATFETTTSCQPGLAAGSELGGQPAVTWQWTLDGEGRVASITDGTRTLIPDYGRISAGFLGYRLQAGEVLEEEVAVVGELQDCEATLAAEVMAAGRVISAQQSYTFAGHDPQPAQFTALQLDLDLRNGFDRLLGYSFLDPALAASAGLPDSNGFRWHFVYPLPGSLQYVADQPDLIGEALLAGHSADLSCGTDVSSLPSSLFGRVQFEYQTLSDYLIEQLQ